MRAAFERVFHYCWIFSQPSIMGGGHARACSCTEFTPVQRPVFWRGPIIPPLPTHRALDQILGRPPTRDIKCADHAGWTPPHPQVPLTHPLACPRRSLMDSFFATGTLADWLKLVLIGNFFNAQLLLSVVSYAWEAMARRFYTTVEFDEFDSTFCE
jgi:hypothetical protein